MTYTKVRLEMNDGGRVARIFLAELDRAFTVVAARRDLCAVVLAAEGPHFSFGASVQEHLPGEVAGMLSGFHALVRRMMDTPAPMIAALRGQCLGGGFELALACDLIMAEETAQLGVPEIKLAVFPPVAVVLLPVQIGTGPAAELALTGASWTAARAAAAGLVSRTVPAGTLDSQLDEWLRQDFLPLSPAALRNASAVVRRRKKRALEEELPAVERLYLTELMAEPDAEEGLRAFLEKRPPKWRTEGKR
jgi:cyclohexa-1,5-dienecarbonyl-CoA hydratase